jgi:hypothetical protein
LAGALSLREIEVQAVLESLAGKGFAGVERTAETTTYRWKG